MTKGSGCLVADVTRSFPAGSTSRQGRTRGPTHLGTRDRRHVRADRKGVGIDFESIMVGVSRGFEALGAAVLVIGSVWALVTLGVGIVRRGGRDGYGELRRNLGRVILLGLEILIIADIIRTMTLDLTVQSALGLGVIVVVRTLLSFALEIELEGVAPWRRAEMGRRRKSGGES